MDRWWSIMQTANATGTYTNLTNYNGVDVHVFRYDFDYSYEWEQQVTEWMEQNREAFRAILRFVLVQFAEVRKNTFYKTTEKLSK